MRCVEGSVSLHHQLSKEIPHPHFWPSPELSPPFKCGLLHKLLELPQCIEEEEEEEEEEVLSYVQCLT